ncbi:sensor histidine kinase [Nocardioides sp.]|uniref:sensor histidine kinase n=1 Tax=Nocardioides sp. TaxID=35761 RepID=UPI002C0D65EC|nr:sensor histidine kinase [Nocardioides sp.]HXH81094.1 sensor histidine kinase [Nocardioides sp.]
MNRLRGVAGPLCLWLLVMSALGLMVARGQAQERDGLVEGFQSRAENGSNVVAEYVDDVFTAERRLAREMSRPDWKPADFAANADLLNFGSAMLLDGEGRVVAVVPSDSETQGAEVASKYEHLDRTLARRPNVSDMFLSAEGKPVVAFSLPIMTSERISVLSASFDLAAGPLAAVLARQPVPGTHGVLLDSDGEVILSSGGETGLAQSMLPNLEGSPLVVGDRVVAAEPVQGTPWTFVLDAPRDALVAPGSKNDVSELVLLTIAALVSLGALLLLHRAKVDRITAHAEQEESAERLRSSVDSVKDEFVASVSHELRTPLTSVLGHLEMLSSRIDLPRDVTAQIKVIERNAVRLDGLVSDLLQVAQDQVGVTTVVPARCDVAALVQDAVDAARPVAYRAGVHLDLNCPDSLVSEVDAQRLRQVMDNLISNGVKYTDEGGFVTVTLRQVADHVELEVADTGIGMSAADLEKLFTRFFRTSAAQSRMAPGTGLGLSIVRSIIEAHDGEVSVESEIGRGTTILVSLPHARCDSVSNPEVRP